MKHCLPFRQYFTVRRLIHATAVAAIWLMLGFPVCLWLAFSFGFPDFLRGDPDRFLLAAALPAGILARVAFRYLAPQIRRILLDWRTTLPALALTALIAGNLYLASDPYQYRENRYVLTATQEKTPAQVVGVYGTAGKTLPLTGVYTFDAPTFDSSRDLRNIPLGTPGFESLGFSLSTHKLQHGAYVRIRQRARSAGISSGGFHTQIRTDRFSEYAALPRFPHTPDDPPAPWRLVLPGLLLVSLAGAAYLLRCARIFARTPDRIFPHAAFLLCAAGFCWTFGHYDLQYSTDPVGQFRQGFNARYMEWHPPVMAFLWIWTTRFFHWISGTFSAAEAFAVPVRTVYWTGIFLLSRYAGKRSGFPGTLAVLALGFAPVGLPEFRFVLQLAWKDGMMTAFYLLTAGLLLNLPEPRRHGRRLAIRLLALVCFAIGTGLRANAVLAAVPLAWLFFADVWEMNRLKNFLKLALASAAVMILTYGSTQILHWQILKMEPQTPLSYPMFKEVLAMRALSGDREWPSFVAKADRESIDRRYRYEIHNANTDTFLHLTMHVIKLKRSEYEELKAFWLRKIKEHPREYWEQKCDSFHRQMRFYDRGFPSLAHPWHLFWLAVFAACYALRMAFRRGGERDRTGFLIGAVFALSGLCYLATYFLFAFVADFRYLLWFCAASVLAAVCCFPAERRAFPNSR